MLAILYKSASARGPGDHQRCLPFLYIVYRRSLRVANQNAYCTCIAVAGKVTYFVIYIAISDKVTYCLYI